VVDKHTAVINALLKNDDFTDLRLDWEMLREVVAAEDGLPIEIAQPDQTVLAVEPAFPSI
jgi:L,D-transpeptidase ErfK/SrfK